MPLKSYKKRAVKFRDPGEIYSREIEIEKEEIPPTTLWDLLVGIRNDFNNLIKTSTLARILIPSLFIIAGSIILSRQIFPEMKQRAREISGYYESGRPELVKGDSIRPKETYLSNPGSEYFKELTKDALSQHVLQNDPVSLEYKNNFKISIPSLELNSLPVKPNVESGVESAYQEALKGALAHFKGTSLPISDINNNIVIYGHSAGGDYYSRTKDITAAFSKLSEIKIGDEVSIEIEGQTHKYRVVQTKIVKPEDVSIITGQKNKSTLTLFTCYPNGNNAKRFVAIARPID